MSHEPPDPFDKSDIIAVLQAENARLRDALRKPCGCSHLHDVMLTGERGIACHQAKALFPSQPEAKRCGCQRKPFYHKPTPDCP